MINNFHFWSAPLIILKHIINILATTGKVSFYPKERHRMRIRLLIKQRVNSGRFIRRTYLYTTDSSVQGYLTRTVKGLSFTVNILFDWRNLGILFLWDKQDELLQIATREIAINQAAFVSRLTHSISILIPMVKRWRPFWKLKPYIHMV